MPNASKGTISNIIVIDNVLESLKFFVIYIVIGLYSTQDPIRVFYLVISGLYQLICLIVIHIKWLRLHHMLYIFSCLIPYFGFTTYPLRSHIVMYNDG
jgi:hypothetical protein